MKIEDFTSQFKGINTKILGVRLPTIEVPDGMTSYKYLVKLSNDGLKRIGAKEKKNYKEYLDRAKYELGLIKELGYEDYFVLVWDVVQFCRNNDIPMGFARGSGGGSLILNLIEVTMVDPIEHDLYFERFISKARAKKEVHDGVTYFDGSLLPDVDIDICFYRRHEVIAYINKRFAGRTSKILTLNTLSGKLLMKECGKIVDNKEEVEMNDVTAMIPSKFGKIQDISEVYDEVEDFKDWCDVNPDSYRIALKLKGLNKNKSVHASGYVVSFADLLKTCPVELDSGGAKVSSFDMNWVQEVNVKLDLLGLKSASVVDAVCKRVGISLADIDVNDPFIYQQFQDLRCSHGLFQIEADTNKKVCRQVKPRNLDELSAVLALARPGALDYVDTFANYTNNGVLESQHSFFDDILSSTGGGCIYQEQMMKMANKIGFTLDESEILRRIVGKKKKDQMVEWEQKVKDKIKENKLDEEVGDILWKVLNDSADYSFNKSHSIAYAMMAACTVYLKFKYPKEFALELLRMSRHEPDPINEINMIERELVHFKTKLLRPHIIKSELDFSIEGDDIRFGLLAIKGVSDKSMKEIHKFKSPKDNKFDTFEAAKECGINVGVLSALIQAGAMEGFGHSRSYLVYEAQLWSKLTDREKKLILACPVSDWNYKLVDIVRHLSESKNENGVALIKESRMETIRKNTSGYRDIYNQNRKNEDFANWYYENLLLGYCHGKSLLSIFIEKNDKLIPINEVEKKKDNTEVFFIGKVKESKSRTSGKGNRYLWIETADETSQIRVMVFNNKRGNLMDRCLEMNHGLPPKGSIVIIKGSAKTDVVFAEIVAVQSHKIYTKLSDLRK